MRTASGGVVGRTDFAWEEQRVVGEFDGRIKYGRLLRPGQDPGDAVFEEKRREDAIRDEGWGVVRWVWSDLRARTAWRHASAGRASEAAGAAVTRYWGVVRALPESCRTPRARTTPQ